MSITLDEGSSELSKVSTLILEHRLIIGLFLLAITGFMGYWAAQLQLATHFEDSFPVSHPDTLIYRNYKVSYRGALKLLLMLRVRRGNIFNPETLRKISDITSEVNLIPGVDKRETLSLISDRVSFTTAMPGSLVNFSPVVPKNRHELEQLKYNVDAHREAVTGLLSIESASRPTLDRTLILKAQQR